MRSPLELLIALWAALRLRWLRFRARRLLAEGLPRARALLDAGKVLALPQAVRVPLPPATVPDGPGGDYPALQLGAQAIRAPHTPSPLLLRIAALPPAPPRLEVLRPQRFRLDAWFRRSSTLESPRRAARPLLFPSRERRPSPALSGLRLSRFGLDEEGRPRAQLEPRALARPTWSLSSRPPGDEPTPEISAARPELLGLDDDLLPPSARDQPAITTDRAPPPAAGRTLKPRTPLARAPLTYFDPRAYRMDAEALRLANEALPVWRHGEQSWLHPALRREVVEVRALERRFLWPATTFYEWFIWWFDKTREQRAQGAREAVEGAQPEEIRWKLLVCKEQMLIRRDVAKDEEPPKGPDYYQLEYGTPMENKAPLSLDGLILPPEWIPSTVVAFRELDVDPLPGQPFNDASLQRSALLRSLED